MKGFRSIKRIQGYFLRRQFSLGLHALAGELPDWLFQFNKARIIYTESFQFPRNLNSEVHVHIADESDKALNNKIKLPAAFSIFIIMKGF